MTDLGDYVLGDKLENLEGKISKAQASKIIISIRDLMESLGAIGIECSEAFIPTVSMMVQRQLQSGAYGSEPDASDDSGSHALLGVSSSSV